MVTCLVSLALQPRPREIASLAPRLNAIWPPLCFHNLTNCFSPSPFLFTTIQIARGVTPSESSILRLPILKLQILRELCASSAPSVFNFFHFMFLRTLCPLLRSKSRPSRLFSIASALFCKHRGWGGTDLLFATV